MAKSREHNAKQINQSKEDKYSMISLMYVNIRSKTMKRKKDQTKKKKKNPPDS